MTPETYAQVSNLLIPTATVIYVLAMVSHAMEWALGRAGVAKTAVVQQEVLVASDGEQVTGGSAGSSATDDVDEAATRGTERIEAASRIGLLLTWLAFVLHLGGVVTRGLAAGRVPWGNMYEFSITASLAVAIVYLIFVQRYKLQYLGLGVTFVVAAVLGLAALALYLAASLYLFFMGWRAMKGHDSARGRAAAACYLALLAAYWIPGLTLASGYYSDLNLYFFFMLGLLLNSSVVSEGSGQRV